jgi:hypothetical protein
MEEDSHIKQDSNVNDDIVYESPHDVKEYINNAVQSRPKVSTEQPSVYASLKNNEEPENVYQSLHDVSTAAHPHHAKDKDDKRDAEYEMQQII